jgi:hypothetical protein
MYKRVGCALVAASAAMSLLGAAARGHDAIEVRGTIERTDGNIHVVKLGNGAELRLNVHPDAGVAVGVKGRLWEIKEGSYLGIAGIPQPDGSQRALEVHLFHETLRGIAEGHWTWDLQPQSTLTYGTGWHIAGTAGGNSVTLYHKDGENQIVIPSGAAMLTFLPGNVAELKPGISVFVPAAVKQLDGVLHAQYVMISGDVDRSQ